MQYYRVSPLCSNLPTSPAPQHKVADDVTKDGVSSTPFTHRMAVDEADAASRASGRNGMLQGGQSLVQYYYYILDSGKNPGVVAALGDLYLDGGHGVERDYKTAFEWYTKAAAEDHGRAWGALGHMHTHGLGVPVNYSAAFHAFNMVKCLNLVCEALPQKYFLYSTLGYYLSV